MLKKDKLQLILRAKHGSQILKYLNPAGPITSSLTMPAGNPFMTSDGMPTVLLSSIDTSNISTLNFSDPLLGVDTRSGFRRGFDKFKTSLSKGFKDFANNGGFGMVLNVANGLINAGRGNLINSSGVDIAFGAADMVGDIAGKINPVAGAAVKGLTTVFKGIDALFGSNSKKFGANQDVIADVGGSYGGSVATINEAASKANKKYGLFSSGARRRANALIDKATEQQNMMTEIAAEASDQKSMINDFAYMRNQMNLEGGYDQRYMRAAKSGMKIQDRIDFVKYKRLQSRINVNTKQIEEFKDGGVIKSEWKPVIDNFSILKKGGSIKPGWVPVIDEIIIHRDGGNVKKPRTLELLIAYAKEQNPRFIQRLSESPHGIEFIDDTGNKVTGNVYLEWSTDNEGNAIIYPRILEMEDKSLKFLSREESWKRANKNDNILIMSPEEAEIFFAEDPEYQTAYKRGWPNMFKNYLEKVKSSTKELKEGGTLKEELETPEIEETNQKNIIPEGALHKNKHHMEHTESLTQKGIPVIDNEGEQLAEIELDEIIFTLEVTKKLEELYKDGSDKAAIEAGKLLVKEILFNTDDRTGLINKCKKGGKL